MSMTPYPELNAVLRELVDGMRTALGRSFVGAYLQGSFGVGGADEHSDVDFAVVVDEELSDSAVEALQTLHERIFRLDCPWAQHLEGSYFPKSTLQSCSNVGTPLWYLDNGHRQLERSNHCNTVVVRWTVREHGITLAGPPPESLIYPIPVEALRREILDTLHRWGQEILNDPRPFDNRFYQSFIVLSYCRMLHSLQTGTIGSKRAGAEWAKSALEPSWRELIDRTWEGRPNPALSVRQPADPGDFARTMDFIRYCREYADRNAAGWRGATV
ncbi:MAG: DUF4111 domain-containing protein [Candidatus Eisenbacteria bacterium]|jgi:hypothetical protein|nr:DUF4111 domain-containing protein [Candidatus Eisenbacteria bacterium]